MRAERPHVLFAIGGLGLGGSERQLMQLIEAVHPQRLEASLLTFSSICDPGHAKILGRLGVELIQLEASRGPRGARPLVSVPRAFRVMRRLRPDAVYAWLEEASTTITPAARALGIPVVVARRSVCGSTVERQAHFRIPIRLAERQARIVTGNSVAVTEDAAARGILSERLRLVPNGHPPVAPLPPRFAEPVALGYLANYRPEKGHERFLEALELVRARTPWRADLAGAGPAREQVARSIAERGLVGQVSAGPQITDVRGFWAVHDVAVLLSDDEGSPNVLIEAAMLGRPLVGTDAGGTPEVISKDGGFLVPHEPRAIATVLERLIDDAELRHSLGAAARRYASARHDLERSVDAHVTAIQEALAPAL